MRSSSVAVARKHVPWLFSKMQRRVEIKLSKPPHQDSRLAGEFINAMPFEGFPVQAGKKGVKMACAWCASDSHRALAIVGQRKFYAVALGAMGKEQNADGYSWKTVEIDALSEGGTGIAAAGRFFWCLGSRGASQYEGTLTARTRPIAASDNVIIEACEYKGRSAAVFASGKHLAVWRAGEDNALLETELTDPALCAACTFLGSAESLPLWAMRTESCSREEEDA